MNKLLVKLSHMILHLAEMKTNNGVLISDDEIEVGREVFIEDENNELIAAPDGEYVAEDGRTFVVAEGKVAEIREKEAEPETEPETEPEQHVEENQEEQEPEQEPEQEQAPEADEKDKRIAELEAQVEELNQVIVEKDEEIGRLKAELEKSDSQPAEEQLKSQKNENKSWFKSRY